MTFEDIKGNEALASVMKGMVDSGKVPHAIMLHEDDGSGAFALALAFLGYLFGDEHKVSGLIHPDVHFVYPVVGGTSLTYISQFRELVRGNAWFTEDDLRTALGIEGKNTLIAVDEARTVLEALSLSPLEGGWRAIVVYLPEKMNEATANRLLKSIEEPPERTVFLFITHAPEKVLQTIRSRCEVLRMLPTYTERTDGEMLSLFTQLMDAVVGKDLPAALEAGESLAVLPSREKAKAFCKFAAGSLRKIFMLQQNMPQLARMGGEESEAFERYASLCRKSFARQALPVLDEASRLIDRNINLKVLFTDLVCKLYMLA